MSDVTGIAGGSKRCAQCKCVGDLELVVGVGVEIEVGKRIKYCVSSPQLI